MAKRTTKIHIDRWDESILCGRDNNPLTTDTGRVEAAYRAYKEGRHDIWCKKCLKTSGILYGRVYLPLQ